MTLCPACPGRKAQLSRARLSLPLLALCLLPLFPSASSVLNLLTRRKNPLVRRAPRRYSPCMNYLDRITYNPAQCGGRPCIRGMRIRVKDVLDLLAADVPEAEILADYPDLEAGDIKACLQYAAAQADHAVLKVA